MATRVRASAARIGEDRLTIRERDQNQQTDDHGRDRDDVSECRCAEDGEHEEDLFGGVCNRGDRVGRQHRKCGLLVQPFVLQPFAREWAAKEDLLEARVRGRHEGPDRSRNRSQKPFT